MASQVTMSILGIRDFHSFNVTLSYHQMNDLGCSPQPPHPHYKPNRPDQEQVTQQIDTLLEVMNYRARYRSQNIEGSEHYHY